MSHDSNIKKLSHAPNSANTSFLRQHIYIQNIKTTIQKSRDIKGKNSNCLVLQARNVDPSHHLKITEYHFHCLHHKHLSIIYNWDWMLKQWWGCDKRCKNIPSASLLKFSYFPFLFINGTEAHRPESSTYIYLQRTLCEEEMPWNPYAMCTFQTLCPHI